MDTRCLARYLLVLGSINVIFMVLARISKNRSIRQVENM